MIPSNGGESSRKGNKRPLDVPPSTTSLYHPSIYRFYCRGAYFAHSKDKGSQGTCRGIKSRLELLSDMEMSTRADAIKNFTYMTDYELEDGNANDLNEQTKSILVSPALVYREDKNSKNRAEPLPEEELIKRQSWHCYGSTEVEYLVLKDPETGLQTISALAPRTEGLTIRKIITDDESLTSVAVGPINVVMQSSGIDTSDTNDDEVEKGHDVSRFPEEVPAKPSFVSLEAGQQAVTKVGDFSRRAAAQWVTNASWLAGTLQDEFPHRVYSAGEKIAAQLPRTVDQTIQYMGKIIDRYFGDDDGGD
ncbi:predicted protein [Phaeodactylum tricornutum CCAP 1055/1]|jgi:hypothetical protein|uniref:Uncharacterized protein n=2 Tax=Phaeodactylum tricornutum TaxID=2850 RepID=B7FPY4_PHATC|nr:predicted protein [Phaeodactylum tricornutum CCAP 1055/1]EEC51254.1 predicted protein [Phaeodactylum tricornutum CCAP 1055/1]|eukprot:XP_002176791.1 predicted protein [Phaeodactylum tricornutum CCAP 1055/1]